MGQSTYQKRVNFSAQRTWAPLTRISVYSAKLIIFGYSVIYGYHQCCFVRIRFQAFRLYPQLFDWKFHSKVNWNLFLFRWRLWSILDLGFVSLSFSPSLSCCCVLFCPAYRLNSSWVFCFLLPNVYESTMCVENSFGSKWLFGYVLFLLLASRHLTTR